MYLLFIKANKGADYKMRNDDECLKYVSSNILYTYIHIYNVYIQRIHNNY